jgi:glutathione S-transferase
MTELYHFWSSPAAQRVRLALSYKQVPYRDVAVDYHDDETFFDLGVARVTPVLRMGNGQLHTDSLQILWQIDELFPDTPPLVNDRIDRAAWDALLGWREQVDAVLERLYAPVRPAYRDIGADEAALHAYKADVQQRFGMSLEALANDRYDGYAQLDRITNLGALSRHLAKHRFYMGAISVADVLLFADLYPVQIMDGISLPIDLMYYLQRVAETCHTDPHEGLLAG